MHFVQYIDLTFHVLYFVRMQEYTHYFSNFMVCQVYVTNESFSSHSEIHESEFEYLWTLSSVQTTLPSRVPFVITDIRYDHDLFLGITNGESDHVQEPSRRK